MQIANSTERSPVMGTVYCITATSVTFSPSKYRRRTQINETRYVRFVKIVVICGLKLLSASRQIGQVPLCQPVSKLKDISSE